MPLHEVIHILNSLRRIQNLIMRHIIDLMLVQKLLIDLPRCVRGDLIHPSAVENGFTSLGVGHGRGGFVFCAEGVGADTDDEVDVGEGKLGLTELEGVSTIQSQISAGSGMRYAVGWSAHPKWNRS